MKSVAILFCIFAAFLFCAFAFGFGELAGRSLFRWLFGFSC